MATPFVFDTHVDSLQLALDMGVDLGARGPGHLDLVRGREGGLGAVVLTCWVDPAFIERPGGARGRADRLMDAYDELLAAHPEQVAAVTDGPSLQAAQESGRVAAILGIEGGHALEESREVLEHFHGRGLRVLTLVWNNHLSWIRSCVEETAGPEVPAGLGPFGVEVVRRMNELGILVDLSHTCERSFHDTVDASAAPVIASHSGCKALHDHPRNLSDAQLAHLAERDGVVGVPFLPSFLDAGAQASAAEQRATPGYQGLEAEDEASLWLKQVEYLQARVAPLRIERLVDHIAHVAERVGVRHVGLGSDFDGIQVSVAGLEDAACYGSLVEPLERRGFSPSEVAAILGGNMARVFDAATSTLPRVVR
jgi:membrane dipeptidase